MCGTTGDPYVGLMLDIFSPDFDFTNSLLINMPIGCWYLRPLGAVSSTVRSDILCLVPLKVLMLVMYVRDSRAQVGILDDNKKFRFLFSMRGISAVQMQRKVQEEGSHPAVYQADADPPGVPIDNLIQSIGDKHA